MMDMILRRNEKLDKGFWQKSVLPLIIKATKRQIKNEIWGTAAPASDIHFSGLRQCLQRAHIPVWKQARILAGVRLSCTLFALRARTNRKRALG